MLVVMTVDAEVFPVGAVRRIVFVVAVFVVHCEEMPVFEMHQPTRNKDKSENAPRLHAVGWMPVFGVRIHLFIFFFAVLMKRPNALSFLRLSTYDISWYSDSFLSFI